MAFCKPGDCDHGRYRRDRKRIDQAFLRSGGRVYLTALRDITALPQWISGLKKQQDICSKRNRHGNRISEGISGLPGNRIHKVDERNECTYWFYMLRLDESELQFTQEEFSKALAAEGIPNQAGYIPDVVYMQPLFQNRHAYRDSHFPFDLTGITYERGLCPNAEAILLSAIRIAVSEFFTDQDIEDIIFAIQKVSMYFSK